MAGSILLGEFAERTNQHIDDITEVWNQAQAADHIWGNTITIENQVRRVSKNHVCRRQSYEVLRKHLSISAARETMQC